MKRVVVIKLGELVKGYFYGVWLKLFGGQKRRKPLQSVEMVTYTEFQNPRVLVMGTVYEGIGLGVYQGEAVVIREGLCSSEWHRRWVIYKLKEHHLKGHKVEGLLKTACMLVQTILRHKYSVSCWKGLQKSDGLTAESAHYASQYNQPELCPLLTCGDTGIYPTEDVVYQIVQKCPLLRLYLAPKRVSTETEENRHRICPFSLVL
jgi:hypothetical protein